MKKLVSLLTFLTMVAFSISLFFPSMAAADENPIIKIYEDNEGVAQTFTDSETADNYKQTSLGRLSIIVDTEKTLNGTAIIPESSERKQKLLAEKPYLRYGLVQNSAIMMTNAFLTSPNGNIPGHYAQMFLPKELIDQSAGSAYAQSAGQPPESGSASQYLGNGALGLNKLWGISFTLAMSILVVILIIAGFMIMFRSKAGGQVVVTVSMALQNAVIGALLALASYALGVFFLNLSKYLVQAIAVLFQGMFEEYGLNVIYINGPWNLFKDFFMTTVWGTYQLEADNWFSAVAPGIFGPLQESESTGLARLWEIVTTGANAYFQATTYTALSLIARIVIGAAMLFVTLRIFWTVLSTYIKMIIDIAMAPLVLMVSSLPGKQAGFSAWLTRMFKNAIAVPIMFTFVNVGAYMAYAVAASSAGCAGADKSVLTCVTGGLIPAGTTPTTDWLLLAVGPAAVIALVVLNMVPSVPAMVESMFPPPKGGADFGKAWEGAKKSLQGLPVIGGLVQ